MQKRLIWAMLVGIAIVVTALYHTRKVQAEQIQDHNHVCSVASLKGTYAWHRTGVNNVVGGPIAEIGIAFYDGGGTRGAIRNTRSTNGVIRPWTDEPAPNGTYKIDSDCTGSFFDVDGTNSNDVIVLDDGKRYLVLSEAAGTIVSEEGTRIDPQD